MSELGRIDATFEMLKANLDETEEALRELASCLQKERQMVVLFELQPLIHTIQKKERVLARLESLAEVRRPMCESLIEGLGMQGAREGGVPGFLRALGKVDEGRGEVWRAYASELESLRSAVMELQTANQSIVNRASKWVNQYLGQLRSQDGNEYDARGQLAQSSMSTLRRTI